MAVPDVLAVFEFVFLFDTDPLTEVVDVFEFVADDVVVVVRNIVYESNMLAVVNALEL